MNHLDILTDEYFSRRRQTKLEILLAPISADKPEGEALFTTETYAAIRKAREEEDASLPLGQWERELKRADWAEVSRLCIDALTTKSKDLQLALWLLEAECHRRSFAAFAPCLNLLGLLCKTYWSIVYPKDLEHRDNLFRWLTEKFRRSLCLLPLTQMGEVQDYGWADWEQAQRNEQLRASLQKNGESLVEGITIKQFYAALNCTPAQTLLDTQNHLTAAKTALDTLVETLNALCGEDAPLLTPLLELVDNMEQLLDAEIHQRGIVCEVGIEGQEKQNDTLSEELAGHQSEDCSIGTDERSQIYAYLAQIAEHLAQLEPHSPVPYLIKRAVEWGSLNTAELYGEVFVRCNGQINIFELLGLEERVATQQAVE